MVPGVSMKVLGPYVINTNDYSVVSQSSLHLRLTPKEVRRMIHEGMTHWLPLQHVRAHSLKLTVTKILPELPVSVTCCHGNTSELTATTLGGLQQ